MEKDAKEIIMPHLRKKGIERLSVITGGLQTLRTIFHYFEFLEYCGVFRVQLHGIIWRGYDTSLDLDDIIQGINPCTLLLC